MKILLLMFRQILSQPKNEHFVDYRCFHIYLLRIIHIVSYLLRIVLYAFMCAETGRHRKSLQDMLYPEFVLSGLR